MTFTWINRHFTLLLFAILVGTAPAVNSAENRKAPQRIVSAGGSVTEIMFALGLEDQVIAVDSTSLYPPAANELPKVGYFRSLAAEGLLSLNPDLIIGARGTGPEQVLTQVQSLGVDVKLFTQPGYTLSSWQALVKEIGEYFNRSREAGALVHRVVEKLDSLNTQRTYQDRKLNAITLLSIGQRGPVAAGRETVPDLLMQLAGINNLAGELNGYKPFSTELLASQKLDLILIPSHVAASLGGSEVICQNTVIRIATSENCSVHIMDGLLLMGLGSRVDVAVAELIDQANLL